MPAIENANGDKGWFLNGLKHRENGPAVEYADGKRKWFLNGVKSPWLEEILKTKSHLDKKLSAKEQVQSKRKI